MDCQAGVSYHMLPIFYSAFSVLLFCILIDAALSCVRPARRGKNLTLIRSIKKWRPLLNRVKTHVIVCFIQRASEIQSAPCTGDSTDSSDNETDSALASDSLNVSRAKSVSVSDRLLRRGSARKKVLKTCAQYTTHNLKSVRWFQIVYINYTSRNYNWQWKGYGDSASPDSKIGEGGWGQTHHVQYVFHLFQESLQKTGYLSKLGGRIKNWKRRWFVLSENKLSYFKTEVNFLDIHVWVERELGGFSAPLECQQWQIHLASKQTHRNIILF
jgi:hypothetical protein